MDGIGVQRRVNEANVLKFQEKMLPRRTDGEFSKTAAFSHCQPREPPYLVDPFILAASAKTFEPMDGQTRIIRSQAERGTVHRSISTDTGWFYISNDVVAGWKVVTGHAKRSVPSSKASNCFLTPSNVSRPATRET